MGHARAMHTSLQFRDEMIGDLLELFPVDGEDAFEFIDLGREILGYVGGRACGVSEELGFTDDWTLRCYGQREGCHNAGRRFLSGMTIVPSRDGLIGARPAILDERLGCKVDGGQELRIDT